MKKFMDRVLSVFLCIVFCTSSLIVSSSAADFEPGLRILKVSLAWDASFNLLFLLLLLKSSLCFMLVLVYFKCLFGA